MISRRSRIQSCHSTQRTRELAYPDLIEFTSEKIFDTPVALRIALLEEHQQLHYIAGTLTPELNARFKRNISYLVEGGGYYSEFKQAKIAFHRISTPSHYEITNLAFLSTQVPVLAKSNYIDAIPYKLKHTT